MSSEHGESFTKDNLDFYLKELAKEYRKKGGKFMPAEMVLIGGAAILANYGFRDMTTDVDAVIHAASSMTDAINLIGDRFDLPRGWLNTDFTRTGSYSPKLVQYSTYYKSYSNVLTIRTVTAEYLIAMKLRAGRRYKNDLSDVLGILAEHEKSNRPITMEQIDRAVNNLYGGWKDITTEAQEYIRSVFEQGNYAERYKEIVQEEKLSKQLLKGFEQEYPGVMNTDNVNSILGSLQEKQSKKKSVLDQLRKMSSEKEFSSNAEKKQRTDENIER